MFKFYANIKWACQLILQNPKGEAKMMTCSIEQPSEYTKELLLHRFYVKVEKVLCHILRLECTMQERVLLHLDAKKSGRFRHNYDEDEDEEVLDDQDMDDLIDLLTSGIIYLLLTEIVLQESPPTINSYIQGSHTPQQTHSILLRWLINREIRPLHPQRQDLITHEDLAMNDPFQYDVHESLIEVLMHTYTIKNLTMHDVVEAIDAMCEGRANDKEYPFDLEDALRIWINQISVIFHASTGHSGSPPIIEEDLCRELCDSLPLLKAIVAYRPEVLDGNHLLFGEEPSLRNKVYNWQRIIEICEKSLNVNASFPAVVAAKADDPLFKSNLIVFIVDVFCALVYEVNDEDEEDEYDDEGEEMEDSMNGESHVIKPTTVDTNVRDDETRSIGNNNSQLLSDSTMHIKKLKQSQIVEVQSSFYLNDARKSKVDFATERDETDDEDSVLFDSVVKLNLSAVRAASANSDRYRQLRESHTDLNNSINTRNNIDLPPDISINSTDEIVPNKIDMIGEPVPVTSEPLPPKPSTVIHDNKLLGHSLSASSSRISWGKSNTTTRSQVFSDKKSLNMLAASISGHMPSRANTRESVSGYIPTQDQMKELLKKKQEENLLLKLRLQEQEKQIEEERGMLQKLLEKERHRIEQEVIKKFIEPNIQKRKEKQLNLSSGTRSNTPKEEVEQHYSTSPKTTPRLDNKHSDGSMTATDVDLERSKTPESKWNRNGVIQIMPQEDKLSQTMEKKRQEKLEKVRNQKIEEENRRKQEIMKQKRQLSAKANSAAAATTPTTNLINFAQKNLKTHARTNRQLIKNAICHVCLAGRVNEREKSEILSILQEVADTNDHFVILVRDDKSPVFKALYTTDNSDSTGGVIESSRESDMSATSLTSNTSNSTSTNYSQLRKLIGKGPKILTPDMIKAFFKYDSGGKRFIAQPTRSFGVTTDAVVLSEQIMRRMKKAIQ